MTQSELIYPMLAHFLLVVVLYSLLTAARAPSVWNVGTRKDWSRHSDGIESRVSASLSNQFEWPLLFYVASLLAIFLAADENLLLVALAWIFVAGRYVHSGVQELTTNIRLRGQIFTVNFLAVLACASALFSRHMNHANVKPLASLTIRSRRYPHCDQWIGILLDGCSGQ